MFNIRYLNEKGNVLPCVMFLLLLTIIIIFTSILKIQSRYIYQESLLESKKILLLEKQAKNDIIDIVVNGNIEYNKHIKLEYNEGYIDIYCIYNKGDNSAEFTIYVYSENGHSRVKYVYYYNTLDFKWYELR